MLKKIYFFFLLTRPKTLAIGVCSVVMATHSFDENSFESNFENFFLPKWVLVLLCYITVLACQISSNIINDYLDFNNGVDNKERKGPKRILQQGLLSKKEVLIFYFITVLITIFFGSLLAVITGHPYFIILLLIGVLFSYLYSGGPFPLSHYGIGEVTAFIFFGPFVILNLYFLLNDEITQEIIMLSIITGSFSAMIMLLNNYRDTEQDKKAKKVTIVNFSDSFFITRVFPIFLYTSMFISILSIGCFWKFSFYEVFFLFLPLPLFIFWMINKKMSSIFSWTLWWGISTHILVIL